MLTIAPGLAALSAAFIWAAWFCDRLDGSLARRQGTTSATGAWLDANIDELLDVAIHLATASAAAGISGTPLPWLLVALFLGGKHLFMYGLSQEQAHARQDPASTKRARATSRTRILKAVYHAPANADIRIHVVLMSLVTGWFMAALWYVALYYNLRWIVRYWLVCRRMRGGTA